MPGSGAKPQRGAMALRGVAGALHNPL